jgi:class 3 adenylate cyclase
MSATLSEGATTAQSQANLDRLLQKMLDSPEAQDEIIAEIELTFGQHAAVLVLDMSGFSRTTRHHGIVRFMLMIFQMRILAETAISKAGGSLVKAEADNLYCRFKSVEDAVSAAIEITERLETVNPLLPNDRRLYASIGIGFGEILFIDGGDMFGDQVNLTSKLDEDIAQRGEILLTEAARGQLALDVVGQEKTVGISGIALPFFQIR